MKTGVLAALIAAAAGSAWAAPKPPALPGWASAPTPQEQGAALAPMQRAGVGGRAVVRCDVEDVGSLKNCDVVRETPANAGYGKAALSLAPRYKRAPPGPNDPRTATYGITWFPMDTPPDWLRRPSAEDLLTVWPAEAAKRGQGGKAVVSCMLTVQGVLADCVAIDETPGGFGSAAIALTPQFLMKPAMLKGAPVPSAVTVPLNFISHGPMEVAASKKVVPANLAWAEAPSYADVAAAYPKKAREEKVGGRATLACNMGEDGRLRFCELATSEPRGYGFDSAAKALARQFRFEVATEADRKATRSISVHLPVAFNPSMLDGTTPVIGKPTWTAIPNADQIKSALGGDKATGTVRVTLSCTVQPGGLLSACTVASEEPAGVGASALNLVPAFRVSTWTAEGLPAVGGVIRIPLRYEGGGSGAPAAAK